jgi:hypothetical protein
MPEFRKLFDLPAVKLSREDIENIGRLITDGLPIKPKAFNFSLSDGDTTYRAYSLDELLSQNLPSSIDDLSFSVHGWSDEYKIDRGITISLRRTIASCQIHALDEVWFKGKIQQIMEFFERRKPWYGNTRPSLAGIFGGFQMLSLYALLFLLWKKEFLFSLFAGFTFAAIIKGFANGDFYGSWCSCNNSRSHYPGFAEEQLVSRPIHHSSEPKSCAIAARRIQTLRPLLRIQNINFGLLAASCILFQR